MLFNLTILLPCNVCLFGAIWMLCNFKNNTRAQHYLWICLLFSSVFFFCTANYMAGVTDYKSYRVLDMLDSFFTLLIIPTMYLYFRATTHEGRFTWKDYIWFLPAVVVGIGTSVLYLAMDRAEAMGYIQSVLIHKTPTTAYSSMIYKVHRFISVELYNFTVLIQILGAGFCAVVNLRSYHNRLREFYSDMDDKSVEDDNKMLFWFMLTIPLALGIIIPKRTFWEQHPLWVSLYFIVWSAVYFGMLYYGSRKKYTVEHLAKDLEQADNETICNPCDIPEAESAETEAYIPDDITRSGKYAKYRSSFEKLIKEERIFLQSSLRASEMAGKMGTNRTYLSRMIKEEFGCTFSDYINCKRIEYSQISMRENPGMKLSELAEQSGFSSLNSYGRTFKQITGISPKEWFRRNVLLP